MKPYSIRIPKNRTQGFTLIEVMIVVVIIAILVSIAWPLYRDQSHKSQRTEAVSMASLLRLEMERCASNNNGVYAAACPGIATALVIPVIAAKYDPTGTRGAIYTPVVVVTGVGTGYNIVITNAVGNDNDCVTFTINNLGLKSFTEVAGSTSNVVRCWGSN